MSIVKSFSVGEGDTFYIKHNSDNFTVIDCDISEENADRIISELKLESSDRGVTRFISTHPDGDHFGGIEILDANMPIVNFYVVKNQATKISDTDSFTHYCQLRDGEKAYYIFKECRRKWMNIGDEERASSGISVLWPDTSNILFKDALEKCNSGESFNNVSAVIQYKIENGASFLWLGDLDTEFMEDIFDHINLTKTTIVFAAHHGRYSGKIPDKWLEKLDPQIIVIGEPPSRHLHYYTGYTTITQNKAGDITFDCEGDKVHIYGSDTDGVADVFENEYQSKFSGYLGTITVETEYTLDG
jgi:beta-lactamase superfamily II metal-dependent hydrolase